MVSFRPATEADLPAIVALLADDPLGAAREGGDPEAYRAGFRAMQANPAMQLIVGEAGGEVVATYHLALLPGISERGAVRAILEAVRVASHLRSQGVGAELVADAGARAQAGGARTLELTTHKSRTRAHAFYERLGFTQSHLGYKRGLTPAE